MTLLNARIAIQNKALAEVKTKAAAAARAKAQANVERAAAIKARKAAKARTRRLAKERRRLATKAPRHQTKIQKTPGTASAAHAFRLSGSVAATGPVLSVAGGSLAANPVTNTAITAALRTAVSAIAEFAAATAGPAVAGFAALFYSPKLANGELPQQYAFSTPLSDLAPTQNSDLQALAAAGGTIDLPARVSSKAVAPDRSELLVVKTDGLHSPSNVRVVSATYNAEQNIYVATTEDTPPRTLTWTPIVQPGNSSTALPAESPVPPSYTGASVIPIEGRIDPFPEITEDGFDDYVFVFPLDSGLPPLYVMFKGRRDEPGLVLGSGAPFSGVWSDAASKGEGIPIPSQIADQLRGRTFRNFKKFRESFWKAVAEDPVLGQQFDSYNLAQMKKGRSAVVSKHERVGKRYRYELHHKQPISQEGEVYNLDNINVITPRLHIKTHRKHK